MNGLLMGLAVVAGFILGVRVGIALGHRSARRMLLSQKARKKRELAAAEK